MSLFGVDLLHGNPPRFRAVRARWLSGTRRAERSVLKTPLLKARKLLMRNRFKDVLINPTWEQVVEREPVIAFSFYLSGRVNVLLDLADEIIDNLDQGFSGPVVDGNRVDRAEL